MLLLSGIPKQQSIYNILFEVQACKKWLVAVGIIWKIRICEKCNKQMFLNLGQEKYNHYCNGKKKRLSMWKNTFFSRTKLKPNLIINLIYMWLCGYVVQIIRYYEQLGDILQIQ